MNILYCLACNIGLTGTPVFVKGLSEGFTNSNIYVYTPYGVNENIFSEDITIIEGKINKHYNRYNRYLLPYRIRKSLKREFSENKKIDVVHINTANVNVAYEFVRFFQKKKCKVICHSHNVIKYKNFFLYRLLILYKKIYIVKNSDKLLACSIEAGNSMFGVNTSFEVINNNVNTSRFVFNELSRLKIRKNYEDKIILGHVGAFNDQKNHLFLLQVLKKLDNNFILMLVGDGYLKQTCKKFCEDNELSDRVVFCGNQKETHEYYSAFDIFVLPSLHEGCPLVLLEARCSNLNKIVSCHVPPNDVFDAQYLPLEVDEWVERIQEVSKNLNVRSDESNAIKQAGFDRDNTIRMIREIYLEKRKNIK